VPTAVPAPAAVRGRRLNPVAHHSAASVWPTRQYRCLGRRRCRMLWIAEDQRVPRLQPDRVSASLRRDDFGVARLWWCWRKRIKENPNHPNHPEHPFKPLAETSAMRKSLPNLGAKASSEKDRGGTELASSRTRSRRSHDRKDPLLDEGPPRRQHPGHGSDYCRASSGAVSSDATAGGRRRNSRRRSGRMMRYSANHT